MPAGKAGLPPFPIQEYQSMWCSQCHWLGWAGKGRDFSLEQVSQHLLVGFMSACEANKELSGTILQRNGVLLEDPHAVAEWVIVDGKKVVCY